MLFTERVAGQTTSASAFETEQILTRKRAVELCGFAYKIAKQMDRLGIKKNEHCYFGNLMRDILQYPK